MFLIGRRGDLDEKGRIGGDADGRRSAFAVRDVHAEGGSLIPLGGRVQVERDLGGGVSAIPPEGHRRCGSVLRECDLIPVHVSLAEQAHPSHLHSQGQIHRQIGRIVHLRLASHHRRDPEAQLGRLIVLS